MSEPVCVLLVAPLPPPVGGIARWTERVLEYAPRRTDVAIAHVDSAVRSRSLHDTSTTSRIRVGIGHARTLRQNLHRALHETNPGVVHLTTSGSLGTLRDLALMRECRSAGVPVVYHIRFGRLAQALHRRRWEGILLKAAIRRAAMTIVLDRRSEDAVARHVPGSRCVVLPNPVAQDFLEGAPINTDGHLPEALPETPFVLFAGHVTPAKGVTDLLNAWSRVDAKDWRLVIAGSGGAVYPHELIGQLGIHDSVLLVGELGRTELRRAMFGCAVFVLPSHTEGFPNVVAEAMASGRPIIGTEVGAMPEMLGDGAGVLLSVGDVEGLAETLTLLMCDSDMRSSLGAAARLRAQGCYGMDNVLSQYAAVWSRVASGAADN